MFQYNYIIIASFRNTDTALALVRWTSLQFGSQLALIFAVYPNHSLWPQLWFVLRGAFNETSVGITLCTTACVHLC